MSIGNLKDSGNQGNNMPWQWQVLKGLQAILDEASQPLTCDDEVTVCGTTFTGGSLNTNITNGKTTYLVEHEANSQSNIVSFNILGSNQEEKTNIKSNKNKTKTKQEETKNVEIKINNVKSASESSENEHYLECYGNC